MQIKKTNLEDLAILKLFVNKLEEELENKGLDYFDTTVVNESIDSIRDPHDFHSLDYESSPVMKKFSKRTRLYFNSSGMFFDDYMKLKRNSAPIDDTNSTSKLDIEWDYFTNVFAIRVTSFEVSKSGSVTGLIDKNYETEARIDWDFGFENRRDIQLIKVRLGKLYKKVSVYKKNKRETDKRKTLIDVAVKAFPDFVDSLILGGSDEK
jgi:hypothetical protein